MKQPMEGWTDRENVYIPPVLGNGFREKIIIREYIPPREKTEPAGMEEYAGDAPTVFVSDTDCGDDRTVLVQDRRPGAAFIRRLKTGETVRVAKDEFVIGKQAGADYVIRDNRTVSRRHARVYFADGSYWLEDLNSSNHVFVDGRQIDAPVKLSDGMRFRLSDDENFEFMEENGGEPAEI